LHTPDNGTPSDNGLYDDQYWETVDVQRLAGITLDTVPLDKPRPRTGQGTHRMPASNSHAGGVTLGRFGVLGHDVRSLGGQESVPDNNPPWFETSMRARKS